MTKVLQIGHFFLSRMNKVLHSLQKGKCPQFNMYEAVGDLKHMWHINWVVGVVDSISSKISSFELLLLILFLLFWFWEGTLTWGWGCCCRCCCDWRRVWNLRSTWPFTRILIVRWVGIGFGHLTGVLGKPEWLLRTSPRSMKNPSCPEWGSNQRP